MVGYGWRLMIRGLMAAAMVATLAGCGDLAVSPTPDRTLAPDLAVREIVVQADYAVGDLRVHVAGATIAPDHVVLELAITNEGDEDTRLFLGGCGPSQGTVHTQTAWHNVYYAGLSNEDLTVLPAGATRTGRIMLRGKPGETFNPGEVLKMDLHPGYIFNSANELQRLTLPIQVA